MIFQAQVKESGFQLIVTQVLLTLQISIQLESVYIIQLDELVFVQFAKNVGELHHPQLLPQLVAFTLVFVL